MNPLTFKREGDQMVLVKVPQVTEVSGQKVRKVLMRTALAIALGAVILFWIDGGFTSFVSGILHVLEILQITGVQDAYLQLR